LSKRTLLHGFTLNFSFLRNGSGGAKVGKGVYVLNEEFGCYCWAKQTFLT